MAYQGAVLHGVKEKQISCTNYVPEKVSSHKGMPRGGIRHEHERRNTNLEKGQEIVNKHQSRS